MLPGPRNAMKEIMCLLCRKEPPEALLEVNYWSGYGVLGLWALNNLLAIRWWVILVTLPVENLLFSLVQTRRALEVRSLYVT